MDEAPSLVHINAQQSDPDSQRLYQVARRIVDLCKEHGVAVVGLLCDANAETDASGSVPMTLVASAGDSRMLDPMLEAVTEDYLEKP